MDGPVSATAIVCPASSISERARGGNGLDGRHVDPTLNECAAPHLVVPPVLTSTPAEAADAGPEQKGGVRLEQFPGIEAQLIWQVA